MAATVVTVARAGIATAARAAEDDHDGSQGDSEAQRTSGLRRIPRRRRGSQVENVGRGFSRARAQTVRRTRSGPLFPWLPLATQNGAKKGDNGL